MARMQDDGKIDTCQKRQFLLCEIGTTIGRVEVKQYHDNS
jgi:hypothetical protein